MKIHNSTPKQLVRVQIKKHKEKTMYLNFEQCTHKSAVDELTMYVHSLNVTISSRGNDKTTLIVRDYQNARNGTSVSIPLLNTSVIDICNLLKEHYA